MKIPLLSFVGWSGTGKTTLIERLIPILASKGIRVGVIKHHPHDFDIDREGKDSYRLKKAGARITVIVSPKKIALVEDLDRELDIDEIVARHVSGVDLIITEGYKGEKGPRIEVYNFRPDAPPLSLGHKELLALVTDLPMEAPVPVLSRDDIDGVAEFIIKKLRLLR
ncbi:MAG: molybdopterin-guanine dinucleotide biosynthesis protein B [Syntrophorhabdales bacterium]|jgi:molybdopterin-guanine dinucleotide biosynthesis protein MobB